MASYRMTVGDIADIPMGKTSVKATFNSTNDATVVMLSVIYKKKIFAPSEIYTKLSILPVGSNTIPSVSILQSKFSNKLVKLELEITNKDSTKSYETVAENFFVFKMKPSFIKDASGVTVELFIYSMDKLLTIDKYCNAFTARKLGDVFLDELSKFSVSGKDVSGSQNLQILKYSEDKEVRQPYMIQYNETFYDFLARYASRCGEFLYFEDGQLHLGMKPNLATASTEQKDVAHSIDYEDCMDKLLSLKYRHYNFFNYSSTDDNRYVDSTFEVLGKYKEEKTSKTGTIETGGVTETNTKTYEKGFLVKTVVTTYYTKNEEKTEDKELAGKPKSEVTTITHQDSDGNKLIQETETVTYNYEYDSIGKKYKKIGGDYLYHTTTNSSKEYLAVQGVYNQPEPNDGNFEELEKNGYTDFETEWWDWRLAGFQGIFLKIFNNTSLYDIISDMAWSLAQSAKDTKVDVEKKNDRNNDKNLTLTTSDNPDQTDGTTFSLFSTLKSQITNDNLAVNKTGDKVSLLVADFYAKMQMAAAVVSRVVVKLNFGENHQSLKLGDVIMVNGEFYIVKQVEAIVKPKGNSGDDLNASSNNSSNDSSNNSSNDSSNDSSNNDSNNSSSDNSDDKSIVDYYAVEAIPLFYTELSADKKTISKAIPCAPLMPEIPTIRTSEPQVAFVESNLDPNRFGRVRVRYPWQVKDGDLSPWIRMATPFATAGGGMTFRPYPGDEVLLNYEDGNIERPYIVGSLQSKYVTDPWLPLPDRVIRTKNGHSITFTDGDDGANFLWGLLPGSSFIKSCVPIYQPLITDQNMVDLTGGIKIHDRYGLYEIGMSSDKRSVTINSTLGTIKLNAFTGITISAPNGNIKIAGKNVSIAASNKLTLKSGTAVGDHWIPTSGKGLAEQFATDVLDRTVGMLIDLSFFRTLIEVFTRPVDGTLKIKSGSFVLIEAGKGEAKVSPADYRHPSFDKLNSPGKLLVRSIMLSRLKKSIDLLTSKVDTMANDIKTAHEALVEAANKYKNLRFWGVNLYDKLKKMKLSGDDDIIKFVFEHKAEVPKDFIKDTIFGFDNVEEFKLSEKKIPEKEDDENPSDYQLRVTQYNENYAYRNGLPLTHRELVVREAIEVANKLIHLFNTVKEWKNFEFTEQEKKKCYTSDNLRSALRELDIDGSFIADIESGTVNLEKKWSKKDNTILKRKIVYKLINEAKDADYYKWWFGVEANTKEPEYDNDDSWKEFAVKIGDSTVKGGKAAAFGIGVKDFTKHYFMDGRASEWMDTFFNIRNKWKAEDTGKVLISDKAGQTIRFDDGVSTLYDNYGIGNSAYPLELRKKVSGVK